MTISLLMLWRMWFYKIVVFPGELLQQAFLHVRAGRGPEAIRQRLILGAQEPLHPARRDLGELEGAKVSLVTDVEYIYSTKNHNIRLP